MKRKYSEAAHEKRDRKNAYIDGLSEDEQAIEARDWHEDHEPAYAGSNEPVHYDPNEMIPF